MPVPRVDAGELAWRNVAQLKELGFAGAFSSLPWWDGRASWFVEEHELLRTIGSVIACPEAPFGTRLARRFEDAPDQAAGLPALAALRGRDR